MATNALLFGLESYHRLEGDINVDVAVGDVPETVEQVSEAVENTDELNESVAEAETVEQATEEMFRNYDRLNAIRNYISSNGITRELVMLTNYDGFLHAAIGRHVPALESFGSYESPTSSHAIAALEGIKETAKKVWEWIKKMLGKVKEFLKNLWTRVAGSISSLEDAYRRMEDMLRDRTNLDSTELKSVKFTLLSRGVASRFKTIFNARKKMISDSDNFSFKAADVLPKFDLQRELDKLNQYEMTNRGITEMASERDEEQTITNPVGDAKAKLEFVKEIVEVVKNEDRSMRKMDDTIKVVERHVSDKEREDTSKTNDSAKETSENELNQARSYVRYLNKRVTVFASSFKAMNKLGHAILQDVATLISKGTKSTR